METTTTGKWLFPYAYNILGTVEDAKDVVQSVLLAMLEKGITNFSAEGNTHKNYLIKSTINAAITLKERRQKVVNENEVWLPEPVATNATPEDNLDMQDVLSYSLLVLMEKLSAKERAVFILSESFDYSHGDIAQVLDITEESSRKILSRARAALFKPATAKSALQDERQHTIMNQFMQAIRERDTAQLHQIMAADIHFYADGGGVVPLVAKQLAGVDSVMANQIFAFHKFLIKARIVITSVNHQPAILGYVGKKLTVCQVFDISNDTGKITRINTILDPAKLKSLQTITS